MYLGVGVIFQCTIRHPISVGSSVGSGGATGRFNMVLMVLSRLFMSVNALGKAVLVDT